MLLSLSSLITRDIFIIKTSFYYRTKLYYIEYHGVKYEFRKMPDYAKFLQIRSQIAEPVRHTNILLVRLFSSQTLTRQYYHIVQKFDRTNEAHTQNFDK